MGLRGLIACPRTGRPPGGPRALAGPWTPALYSRRCAVSSSLLALATLLASCAGPTAAGADRPVRILTGEPTTLDPAAQGDAGSAAITAQLFESLTSFDADLQVRPALAESWQFADDGRQVTFHLRPEPDLLRREPAAPVGRRPQLAPADRPAHPSPLASLILDVQGADAYLHGGSSDPAAVGLHADDASGSLVVDLVRPATDFVNIVAGPSFSVVPPGIGPGRGRPDARSGLRRERRLRPDRQDRRRRSS